MSNSYRPFGLMPVKNNNGTVMRTNSYKIPASLASAVTIGTIVTLSGNSSNTDTINGAYSGFGIPEIAIATAGSGNKLLGAITGFDVIPGNLDTASGFNAASTARIAYVSDDPDQEYHIVDDGVTAMDSTYVGLNANVLIGTANQVQGDTSSLNSSTPATTAAFQLKILGLAPEAGNTFTPFAKWRVKINNHCLSNVVAGV